MSVQFVVDYRSIYTYLANSRIKTLGSEINYLVVDILSVMKTVNNQPSPMCPFKAKYSLTDATRWANRYQIPLSPNKALFEAMRLGRMDDTLLSRAAIAAQRLGIFDRVNDILFAAVWAGSDDLSTQAARTAFGARHEIPRDLWDVADSPEVLNQLTLNNRQAVSNGVFGVPTFFVGSEMFFGNDRMDLAAEELVRQGFIPASRSH